MNKEKNILVLTMIMNFVIAFIKLVSGIMFNFSSLVADSLHSFSDFITDIISMIASKIGKKRANKKYPFGYGMIENIANLIIGIILFLLAVYILISGFQFKEVVLMPIIFVVLIVTIVLKFIIVLILYFNGKKIGSNTLLVSAKESLTDLISSVIVLIVSLLLLFENYYPILRYADCLGSLLISIIVFNISIKIIIQNIEYLLGVNDSNWEVVEGIKEIVKANKVIRDSSIKLIKMGNYYNLYLLIEVDDNITLKTLFNLEGKLKKEIRKSKFKIKFIEIEPIEYKRYTR